MADVELERTGAVAILRLNRPERMNAWTPGMERALRQTFEAAEADPEVRVLLLTGAGRAFCAGADMEGAEDAAETAMKAPPPRLGDDEQRYSYLGAGRKPLIAAINGGTAGVGLVLSLFADIRLARTGAKMTTSFVRRGFVAEHGCAWLLQHLIGPMNAADLLLSGRVVTGGEAEKMGLCRALPDEDFADAALTVARDMAQMCSPRSMAVIKAQLRVARHQTLTEATQLAEAELEACIGTPDMAEGVNSFLEKRPPAFPALS